MFGRKAFLGITLMVEVEPKPCAESAEAVEERMTGMPVVLPTDVDFQIPADGKYVSLVRKGIRSLASGFGFGETDCQDVEVAVGEAVTNAICHGQPANGAASVYVHCRLTPNRLVIEVKDEGQAPCLPLPKCVPGFNNEHGRGWLLIHRLMDRVSVRTTDKGLLVRMIKHRSHPRPVRKHSAGLLAVVA